MKAYISGPMTGRVNLNREVFKGAEEVLKMLGHDVINPHNLPEPEGLGDNEDINWALWLEQDLNVIDTGKFDCLVLLPGYENSAGSVLEVAHAETLGIPCKERREFLR